MAQWFSAAFSPGRDPGDQGMEPVSLPLSVSLMNKYIKSFLKKGKLIRKSTNIRPLGGSVVEHLPWAQVVIPGSWDRVPASVSLHWSLLLPLPVSLPLSLSLMNK